MKLKLTKNDAEKFSLITAGGIIYALGVGLFLSPSRIASGGVSGISIILNKAVGLLDTGTWMVLLNVPVMLAGLIKFKFTFIITTIYSVALSSCVVNLAERYIGVLTQNMMLACVAGTTLSAVGMGMVFRAGSTTGGTDIIIKLLKLRYRHMPTGTLFLITDGVIIAASGMIFRDIDVMLYAAIAVLIHSRVMNYVLYGTDGARMVYIMSGQSEEISARLLGELSAGITFLDGRGAYTGKHTDVIMCVLPPKSLPAAKDIVRGADPSAFVVVTNASSVFGEGYLPNTGEEV